MTYQEVEKNRKHFLQKLFENLAAEMKRYGGWDFESLQKQVSEAVEWQEQETYAPLVGYDGTRVTEESQQRIDALWKVARVQAVKQSHAFDNQKAGGKDLSNRWARPSDFYTENVRGRLVSSMGAGNGIRGENDDY